MAVTLTGTEIIYVVGVQANGQPSAIPEQTTTGSVASLAGSNPNAPIAAGASATATVGKSYLLNTAAGSVLTLPAATGSGGTIRVFVTTTTTSGAHKILAASSSDFLEGIAIGENATTPLSFASAAATNHSLQMPFAGSQPSGGFIGDWFELYDTSLHHWSVKGMYQAGTTPTTPFSTATS